MLSRLMPRTLFARVTLVIVVGLAVAQLLAFASIRHERGQALRELMMTGVELDIASSVAILNRLPAPERAGWLDRLARPNYRFVLEGWVDGEPPASPVLRGFTEAIENALRPYPVTRVAQVPSAHETVRMLVRLDDGSDLVVQARRVPMPVSDWVLWALALQLVVLAACGWAAVRLVTRPLADLASAADRLGPDLKRQVLAEQGPTEVARAAKAFNAMQQRIAGYMDERVEILAAISHDLQTPITRMRLRTELMDDEAARDKLQQDLDAMQALVKEGVTYARTLHGETEPARRLDLDALLDSMVGDYQDTGHPVTLEGRAGAPVTTRPQALRRVVGNLVDNALKYAGDAQVKVEVASDHVVISVIDHGPGIPPDQLDAVLKPFHRVEGSRNRDTGGTGLGLSIAHQLATAIGARLSLHNRPQGGLEVRVELPTA
ncbi:ATP-binding protein [Piscinibacter gummiphilus]|uniref:histidine kinase n=1 Tax=Piscinibacter gummiphilus TaxID=946333 RepID=A0A1W6L7T6_9BURK|nr:ATP-binding protein [Piscinibacter gummiphilus]ARN20208.1 two-component sensor histidine kinase [Piscinibacter gummiphilus]ATU64879.1 two-component sensor histidine kinase [Piscinibacter gummiphilus]GLS96494.1 two-component sensor histidine kinase [Piscinibacter gummiphilus]